MYIEKTERNSYIRWNGRNDFRAYNKARKTNDFGKIDIFVLINSNIQCELE